MESAMPAKKKVRLLVVDDHEQYCELIRHSSEMWSSAYEIECEFASTLNEAVSKIGEWAPTVILMDAYVSETDGLKLIDLMKDTSVPLVVTSETGSSDLRESVLARGASEYISKSQDPDAIESMLCKMALLAAEQADCLH